MKYHHSSDKLELAIEYSIENIQSFETTFNLLNY
jgi:hypothetical protein